MAARRYDGLPVRVSADDAGKGDVLQHGIFVVVLVVALAGLVSPRARDHGAAHYLLSPRDILPFSIQLPTLLVILAGMNELTRVPEPAVATAYVSSDIATSVVSASRN